LDEEANEEKKAIRKDKTLQKEAHPRSGEREERGEGSASCLQICVLLTYVRRFKNAKTTEGCVLRAASVRETKKKSDRQTCIAPSQSTIMPAQIGKGKKKKALVKTKKRITFNLAIGREKGRKEGAIVFPLSSNAKQADRQSGEKRNGRQDHVYLNHIRGRRKRKGVARMPMSEVD